MISEPLALSTRNLPSRNVTKGAERVRPIGVFEPPRTEGPRGPKLRRKQPKPAQKSRNLCGNRQKARQSSRDPSDHLGPPEKTTPVTSRGLSDSQSSLVTLLNIRAPLIIRSPLTIRGPPNCQGLLNIKGLLSIRGPLNCQGPSEYQGPLGASGVPLTIRGPPIVRVPLNIRAPLSIRGPSDYQGPS